MHSLRSSVSPSMAGPHDDSGTAPAPAPRPLDVAVSSRRHTSPPRLPLSLCHFVTLSPRPLLPPRTHHPLLVSSCRAAGLDGLLDDLDDQSSQGSAFTPLHTSRRALGTAAASAGGTRGRAYGYASHAPYLLSTADGDVSLTSLSSLSPFSLSFSSFRSSPGGAPPYPTDPHGATGALEEAHVSRKGRVMQTAATNTEPLPKVRARSMRKQCMHVQNNDDNGGVPVCHPTSRFVPSLTSSSFVLCCRLAVVRQKTVRFGASILHGPTRAVAKALLRPASGDGAGGVPGSSATYTGQKGGHGQVKLVDMVLGELQQRW